MRYENWDVLLFPEDSKIPLQEFKTQCFVIDDQGMLSSPHSRRSLTRVHRVTLSLQPCTQLRSLLLSSSRKLRPFTSSHHLHSEHSSWYSLSCFHPQLGKTRPKPPDGNSSTTG
jgi:hypothetical protein